jgi:3'-phosphoadenosine 5'-phosphosulfate sulfotransferase (PAPS reductase)/FAD synthetase
MKDWRQVKEEGGIFFISHSGGKDSQAMYNHLLNGLQIPHEQIIVVHAHLGAIEWDGVADHIVGCIRHDLTIVQAVTKDGEDNDFLGMVKKRNMWPAPKYRQCTSDLKRGPIYKFIRKIMKERGSSLAVNCTGMRAQESSSRAKKADWSLNAQLSKAGREVFEFLPIHDWTAEEVFNNIYSNGQRPFWAYGERGELNERLSCVFCIMGSVNDHRNGAKHRPELFAELVQMEKDMGHTMFQGETLEQRNGIKAISIN